MLADRKKRRIDQFNEMWKGATQEQRIALLEGLGFNESWAGAESLGEMVDRGGGFVAKDLFDLWLTYTE